MRTSSVFLLTVKFSRKSIKNSQKIVNFKYLPHLRPRLNKISRLFRKMRIWIYIVDTGTENPDPDKDGPDCSQEGKFEYCTVYGKKARVLALYIYHIFI